MSVLSNISMVIGMCLILSSCQQEPDPLPDFICDSIETKVPSAAYHIVLIAGQSNTHSGIGLDPILDSATPQIVQLGRFGENNFKLISGDEPHEHHSLKPNRIGFGLTFAKLFEAKFLSPHDTLILVPCGLGGSGFIEDQWDPGAALYQDAVERVNHLLKTKPNSRLQAILWHQGERDLSNLTYEQELSEFINMLRRDTGDPNTPMVLGGMVPAWVQGDILRRSQQYRIHKVAASQVMTAYANPEIPDTIRNQSETFEPIHYDAMAQRELGKRYFSAFLCLVK